MGPWNRPYNGKTLEKERTQSLKKRELAIPGKNKNRHGQGNFETAPQKKKKEIDTRSWEVFPDGGGELIQRGTIQKKRSRRVRDKSVQVESTNAKEPVEDRKRRHPGGEKNIRKVCGQQMFTKVRWP